MNLQRFRKIIFDLWVQPLCQLGDRLMPKKKNHWGFPVHHIKSEQFIENARAVFECVKTDPGIKKIIFCRSEKPEFELEGAKNTQVVLLQSWRGLVAIMQCRVLFVTHSISDGLFISMGGGAL